MRDTHRSDDPNRHGQGSVSRQIVRLKAGDDDAIEALWDRYFERLVRLAGQRLGTLPRRLMDSEDVALDVFDCLCRGVAMGRFPRLNDRADLWKILLTINQNTVVDLIRAQTAKKRNGQLAGPGTDSAEELIEQIEDDQPSPAELDLRHRAFGLTGNLPLFHAKLRLYELGKVDRKELLDESQFEARWEKWQEKSKNRFMPYKERFDDGGLKPALIVNTLKTVVTEFPGADVCAYAETSAESQWVLLADARQRPARADHRDRTTPVARRARFALL